jgi:glycosyltransferase involved in cell wall biosynthesis
MSLVGNEVSLFGNEVSLVGKDMTKPVFGFLVFTGGSFEGAAGRDLTLANALFRRGYKVVVYWIMNRSQYHLEAGIRQRMLCTGSRYAFGKPSNLADFLGRGFRPVQHDLAQKYTDKLHATLRNFCASVCGEGECDPALVDRLLAFLREDQVTHLLPTYAMISPLALAAKARGGHAFDYLVTFQGEEIFANFAQQNNTLGDYYTRLQQVVAGSRWPAIAVSCDYARRLEKEMGIDRQRLRVMYPGTLSARRQPASREALQAAFPGLKADVPLVTYTGRQDAEKGIDLLLYAAKLLAAKGVGLQVAICGSTSFGVAYRSAIRQIGEHLRLDVHHAEGVPDDIRDALFAESRCVVCPSIHREPFGLVALEAMSCGTPVVVPDQGGIGELIQSDGVAGGLRFHTWDSGDLARQMERILTDPVLREKLSANARKLAANFSVEKMTDDVLAHVGLS